jgi:hypothetical protein
LFGEGGPITGLGHSWRTPFVCDSAEKDYGRFFNSDLMSHLYARECGVKPNKKRTIKCGDWQKIF